MGQNARLGGDGEALNNIVKHMVQLRQHRQAVAGRIDADHRVPGAVQQAVEHAGGDAFHIIGRMIGLQAHAQAPRQADSVAKTGDDPAFAGGEDQILIAHQLADRGGHLRGYRAGDLAQRRFIGGVVEQPVAKIADRQMANRCEAPGVVGIEDQPGHLILLVGNQRIIENLRERNLRQRHFCRHPLFSGAGDNARQRVAGTRRRGLRHQGFQTIKAPYLAR